MSDDTYRKQPGCHDCPERHTHKRAGCPLRPPEPGPVAFDPGICSKHPAFVDVEALQEERDALMTELAYVNFNMLIQGTHWKWKETDEVDNECNGSYQECCSWLENHGYLEEVNSRISKLTDKGTEFLKGDG
jgi:hypothetical protein